MSQPEDDRELFKNISMDFGESFSMIYDLLGLRDLNDENNLYCENEISGGSQTVNEHFKRIIPEIYERKEEEDSEDVTNNRSLLENGETDILESSSEVLFSVQYLNQVFTAWSGNQLGLKCDILKGDPSDLSLIPSEENNYSVGQSGRLLESCVNNVQNVIDEKELSGTSHSDQNVNHNHLYPGKSKLTETRRKNKNRKEKQFFQGLSYIQKYLNQWGKCKKQDCADNLFPENCIHSATIFSRSTKTANHSRKKKVQNKGENNPELVKNISMDFGESFSQMYDLLGSRDLNDENNLNCNDEIPGGSQTVYEPLKRNNPEKYMNFETQKKELANHKKMVKEIKKQECSIGGKKKIRKRGIRSRRHTNNSIPDGDEGNNCGTSSPRKNTPKEQREKSQPFEEYWTPDAIKEGMNNGTIIEGTVRINPKWFKEAYVSSPTGGQDILIDGLYDRNRALEGDLVAVFLISPSQWRTKKQNNNMSKKDADSTSEINKEDVKLINDSSFIENYRGQKSQTRGRVVAILVRHHPRSCAGYLKLQKPNDRYALFSPRDARIPRIKILCGKCPEDFISDPASKKNVLYLARILEWISGAFAVGEIVKKVGEMGDVEAETEAILLDNDLDVSPHPTFSLPTNDMVEEEIKKRVDLRKECIFTIDPSTAKDLDDALSCKELENGNFEIGVHISDVTYYLSENTDLDIAVSKRATSVYLVDRVYHMLPVELCLLCSLLPGEDKFAYSVIWEISKDDANIVSQRIVRSVLNSCAKLAYEHAQDMLENPDKEWNEDDFPPIVNGFSISQISKTVNNLQMIAKKLRKKRFEDGALRIDQTKICVQLDSSGMPVAVSEYKSKDSHRLIEEFMLLANMSTAKFIYNKFPDIAFLRCHFEPNRWPLEQLKDSLASRGIHLNITSAAAIQSSLTRYAGVDIFSVTRHMVLNALCAKTMARANYFCSEGVQENKFWHYALSVPFYTHFTSPIRRYADVMVHRLLNAALGYCSKLSWTGDYVSRIAENCNKKKYSAKLAGEQSIKFYLSIYVRNHQPILVDAVVVDVKDYSFDVIIITYGLTMRVYVTKLDADIDRDRDQKSSPIKIIWRPTEDCRQSTIQIVDIFTLVKVTMQCDSSLKLEAKLVRPESNTLDSWGPESEITSSGSET